MTASGDDVVTGAFSYSGAAIAGELRAAGRRARTLTGHPGRAPAGTPIEVRPLDDERRQSMSHAVMPAPARFDVGAGRGFAFRSGTTVAYADTCLAPEVSRGHGGGKTRTPRGACPR